MAVTLLHIMSFILYCVRFIIVIDLFSTVKMFVAEFKCVICLLLSQGVCGYYSLIFCNF